MKKLIISGLLIAMSSEVFSAPKELHCVTGNSSEERMLFVKDNKKRLPEYRAKKMEITEKHGASSSMVKDYNDIITLVELTIAACPEAEFISKRVFIFDTDGLTNSENSFVEMSWFYGCGTVTNDVGRKIKLEATPNIISFKYTNVGSYGTLHKSFNVERQTLKAGLDANRDYQCTLKDIDTSKNLL
jgi:hypothetical protein